MGPERRPLRLLLAALLAATFHARWSLSLSLSFCLFLSLRRWASSPAAVFARLGGSFDASHVPSFADFCRGRWGGGGLGGSSLVPRDATENTKEKVLLPVQG